jgi:hypothetical protein
VASLSPIRLIPTRFGAGDADAYQFNPFGVGRCRGCVCLVAYTGGWCGGQLVASFSCRY